jgi:accessory gene regulator B
MESKLATMICRNLLSEGAIEEEYIDVYIYGLELVLSFIFSIIVILLAGILLNALYIALIFLTVFIALRRFTGGYHAPTYLRCKLTTIGIYITVTILCTYLTIPLLAYIPLLMLGLYIILRYGPIENIYKPLTPDTKKRNKYIAVWMFLLLSLSGSVIHLWNQKLSNAIYYTLGFVVVLMIIPMLKKGEIVHEEDR